MRRCASEPLAAQSLLRELGHSLVVRLAVARPHGDLGNDDAFWSLVTGKLATHVAADLLLIEGLVGFEFDDAGHGLSPLLVRHANHQRIAYRGMALQDFLVV